jgi:hypothetical protein
MMWNDRVHVGSVMVEKGKGHGIEFMNQRSILQLILRLKTKIHPRFGQKLLSFQSSTSFGEVSTKLEKKFRSSMYFSKLGKV